MGCRCIKTTSSRPKIILKREGGTTFYSTTLHGFGLFPVEEQFLPPQAPVNIGLFLARWSNQRVHEDDGKHDEYAGQPATPSQADER